MYAQHRRPCRKSPLCYYVAATNQSHPIVSPREQSRSVCGHIKVCTIM